MLAPKISLNLNKKPPKKLINNKSNLPNKVIEYNLQLGGEISNKAIQTLIVEKG